MTYRVNIAYPLTTYEWGGLDKGIRALAAEFGGETTGAGTGFGFRDTDCDFELRENAQKFSLAAKTRFPGFSVTSVGTEEA